jgi:dinuclear metal center YbgI/SA1388 family protein
MKLKEIIAFLDEKVPNDLALDFDEVGLMGQYDMDSEIRSIKIFMDLWPQFDESDGSTLIITHHPPLFRPKTPTYTIHSNWDIIDGGANDALSEALELEVIGYFDDETKIGRICRSKSDFDELKCTVLNGFRNVRLVNEVDGEKKIDKVAIISGFGLKNPEYVKLAKDKEIDVMISGDLCQETAILAKNLKITLIDLGHHESEVPGLYKLKELISELDVDIEVVDENPIERL